MSEVNKKLREGDANDKKFLAEVMDNGKKKRNVEESNKVVDAMYRRINFLENRVVELESQLGAQMGQMKEDIMEEMETHSAAFNRLEDHNKKQAEAAKKKEEESHVRTFKLEMEQVAANLIIRNFPGDGESKEDMTAKITDVFEAIGAGHVRIKEAFRFRKRGDAPEWIVPIVKVVLEDASQRSEVFKNLSNLRSTEWDRCSVSEEFPNCVREETKIKNFQAMCFRINNPGFKTKIKFVKGHPQVQAKVAGQEKWDYPHVNVLKKLVEDWKRNKQANQEMSAPQDGSEGGQVVAGPSGANREGVAAPKRGNQNQKAKENVEPKKQRIATRNSAAAAARPAASAPAKAAAAEKGKGPFQAKRTLKGAEAAAAAVAHVLDQEKADESGTESDIAPEATDNNVVEEMEDDK